MRLALDPDDGRRSVAWSLFIISSFHKQNDLRESTFWTKTSLFKGIFLPFIGSLQK